VDLLKELYAQMEQPMPADIRFKAWEKKII
jgi:hypothetical protein